LPPLAKHIGKNSTEQ